MSRGAMRRAQLVTPFGVGAITVLPDGTAVITGGLDHWFAGPDGSGSGVDLDEYMVEEWRLQDALRVSHFRLPPDFRTKREAGDQKNVKLTVPALRFPRWNFCPRCRRLDELPLSFSERRRCPECIAQGKKAPMVAQVPFVVMCDAGHVQDFPFREWVHRTTSPSCSKALRLIATGGASLAAQVVKCDCGKSRTLAQITEAAPLGAPDYPRTFLSSNLAKDEDDYVCTGAMPWHGSDLGEGCGRPLRGSLRAASNLYFALVRSSIYLPRATGDVPEKLIEILTAPPLSTALQMLSKVLGGAVTPEMLRDNAYGELLKPFSDDEVERAIVALGAPAGQTSEPAEEHGDDGEDEEFDEDQFRREEFAVLRNPLNTAELKIKQRPITDYGDVVGRSFSKVMLVDQLRETRALWGFNRVFPEGGGLRDRKALLWKDQPEWRYSWLPAYIVKGEGILLEFDHERLSQWEREPAVVQRVAKMRGHYEQVRSVRRLRERNITPRFVLLHTFAHLLMNQLTFECGYSSASLRERLYVAQEPQPMAAVLIYTAAGDAEGTMGGLVRMGKPGYLETAISDALDASRWCSSDPVCMELGESGQGPDSCNQAACHNCSLVPETACEEFNRFLDRGVVIGTLESESLGYFSHKPTARGA